MGFMKQELCSVDIKGLNPQDPSRTVYVKVHFSVPFNTSFEKKVAIAKKYMGDWLNDLVPFKVQECEVVGMHPHGYISVFVPVKIPEGL
jgi:hypothetical protein